MITLPEIHHRTGVYLDRDDPPVRYRKPEVDPAAYAAACLDQSAHLVTAEGEMLGPVVIRMAINLDPGADPEFCAEIGTTPIAPRPLPMWVGSFRSQTLPNPF